MVVTSQMADGCCALELIGSRGGTVEHPPMTSGQDEERKREKKLSGKRGAVGHEGSVCSSLSKGST